MTETTSNYTGSKSCSLCGGDVHVLAHACPKCGDVGPLVGSIPANELQDILDKQSKARGLVDQSVVLIGQSCFDEAEQVLKQAQQINPYNACAFGNLGGVYSMQGRFEDAIPCFKKALALDPKLEGIPRALAKAKRKTRKGLFQRIFGSSTSAPKTVKPFTITSGDQANEVGNAILMDGDPELAIPIFEQGVAMSPNHLGLLFNLAVAYRLSGRFSEGRRIGKKLLRINSRDMDARAELEGCNEKDSTGSQEFEEARTGLVNGTRKPAVERLTLELLAIGHGDGFINHDTPRPAEFNERGRHKRAYEIGELLNDIGGFQLMQSVGTTINQMPLPRGLEHCWNGIGSWRS